MIQSGDSVAIDKTFFGGKAENKRVRVARIEQKQLISSGILLKLPKFIKMQVKV